tara:strand:+ start:150 stop:566 length:417 start_codon:yes stop_codon:yes gene_type:complete
MNKKRKIENIFEGAQNYLNNLEYPKAKSEFSLIINKTIDKQLKRDAHFYRAISNFRLKRFYNQNGFFIDLKLGRWLYDDFQKSFLWLLQVTPNKDRYDNAFTNIEFTLKYYPEKLEEYKNLLIHLPLEFQIIFKMRFY